MDQIEEVINLKETLQGYFNTDFYFTKNKYEEELLEFIKKPTTDYLPTGPTKNLLKFGFNIIRDDKKAKREAKKNKKKYESRIDNEMIQTLCQLALQGYKQATIEEKSNKVYGVDGLLKETRELFSKSHCLKSRYQLLSYATDFLCELDINNVDYKTAKKRYVCNLVFNRIKKAYIHQIEKGFEFSPEKIASIKKSYLTDLGFTSRNLKTLLELNGNRIWGEKQIYKNYEAYEWAKDLMDDIANLNNPRYKKQKSYLQAEVRDLINITRRVLRGVGFRMYGKNPQYKEMNYEFKMSHQMKKFWLSNNIGERFYSNPNIFL